MSPRCTALIDDVTRLGTIELWDHAFLVDGFRRSVARTKVRRCLVFFKLIFAVIRSDAKTAASPAVTYGVTPASALCVDQACTQSVHNLPFPEMHKVDMMIKT